VNRGSRLSSRIATFTLVLDLLELLELAWHDCYRDISPPEDIVDDVLLLSEGSMEKLLGRPSSPSSTGETSRWPPLGPAAYQS
jgi:hypothetical protein